MRFGQIPGNATAEWFVDHDLVHADSVRLSDWIRTAGEVARRRGDFALIIFDIKVGNSAQVKQLRDIARANLPEDLNRIFSFGDFNDRENLAGIRSDLRPVEGLAIDFDNDPRKVEEHFIANERTYLRQCF